MEKYDVAYRDAVMDHLAREAGVPPVQVEAIYGDSSAPPPNPVSPEEMNTLYRRLDRTLYLAIGSGLAATCVACTLATLKLVEVFSK